MSSKKPTRIPKKKPTKAGFLRDWKLPPTFWYKDLRYKAPPEKGVYWFYFSLFIRERDVKTWGTCISCGKPITIETSQAGHFMPARDSGRNLLFDPLNVNAECGSCNAFDETHLLGYAENLDKRYGRGTAQTLRDRREAYKTSKIPVKDWSRVEYIEKIKALPNYPQQVGEVLQ